jgi:hypothetical protein
MGEKRQRVDSGTASDDIDMDAILAQATAEATKGIEEAVGHTQEEDEQYLDEDEIPAEQPTIFISDPHLSMRILSLPVLESLVRISLIQAGSITADSLPVNADTFYISTRSIFGDN